MFLYFKGKSVEKEPYLKPPRSSDLHFTTKAPSITAPEAQYIQTQIHGVKIVNSLTFQFQATHKKPFCLCPVFSKLQTEQ